MRGTRGVGAADRRVSLRYKKIAFIANLAGALVLATITANGAAV